MKSIHQFCSHHNLITPNDTIIIGLSGGPDSIFLLHFLRSIQPQYNLTLIAAHLDHGWRTVSAEDAAWCKKLCESLAIPFVIAHAQDITVNKKPNGSLEEQGRLLRRAFFARCLEEFNATKIALGHHHDDQLETFFIRVLRGAGTAGLQGMKPQEGPYIRPLLNMHKQEILDYLHEHSITYLNDPSNTHDIFLRNRIRKTLIPAIHTVDARSMTAIKRTFENLQETETFLTDLTQKTFADISSIEDSTVFIDKAKFLALDLFLQKRILLMWLCKEKVSFVPSQQFFDEMLRFITTSKQSNHHMHKHWSIRQKNNVLFIKILS